MEVMRRPQGDELLASGAMTDIRQRMRTLAQGQDLRTVIACAFDHRTRMLPFIVADMRAAPAGVRAIGSALADAGLEQTRIVLQQWNHHFRPSQMRLNGHVPDMFMISSMRIHWAPCQELIRDAARIAPAHRPLIIVGGPLVIHEPWSIFSADADQPGSADVAVTGEEYVLLSLLEVLLSIRGKAETMRSAFVRARDGGMLDDIPGLVYAQGSNGRTEELIDTGPQRLLGNLDELPHPALGYRLLEPPSRRATLTDHPVPQERIGKLSPIGSLVLTLGCRFGCPFCPIPAYNQRQFRTKSGARIADEMARLYQEYGIKHFFGGDDNFLNDHARITEIAEEMAQTQIDGLPLGRRVRWGTEATVHDTVAMKDQLGIVRKAGLRALWMGVEDMTGALVKKGQTEDKTLEAFALLRERGIMPMPMLMHHDEQPLYTRGRLEGLLNQIRLLRKAGAITVQVLMITPAPGSKCYAETYTSGLVIEQAGGRAIEPYMLDGNYVVASRARQPWRKQLNIMIAYAYFYNPFRFFVAIVLPKARLYLADCGAQLIGMWGLVQTIRRTFGWALRLMRGRFKRSTQAPATSIPIRRRENQTQTVE